MALSPGDRLGPYQIVAPLGAGGMGEVYRARDTRLDRTVAIKILPASLAADPEFRDRFDREARALSGLDHPHICALYDVGEQGGASFIVMPLLDGESLAARLARGPLPAAEALTVAAQIADALFRAHRAGIVHRDLKPANVILTKSGAKLLDFGLAKATVTAVTSPSGSMATVQNLTAQGSILGTLQYMAPEQLEGREADERSDVFALGALLYEMVTGRKAFEGSSQASLIAAILEREPAPVSQVQPLAPAALDRIVRKCLAKDPDRRWQSAGDLADELRWASVADATVSQPSPAPRRAAAAGVWPWAIAVASVAALVAVVVLARQGAFAPRAPELRAIATTYSLPPGLHFAPGTSASARFAVSPDGRALVFAAVDEAGTQRLWLRRLDELNARPLAGTERGDGPFWSPDSQSIAFVAFGKLKRIDVSAGVTTVLTDSVAAVGGAWGPDGTILFNRDRGGPLYMVNAGGGQALPATTIDKGSDITWHHSPSFLPGGRHFLYSAAANNIPQGVYIGSLDGGTATLLLPGIPNAAYSDGYVLFVRDTALLAQRFDRDRMRLIEQARTVVDDVGQSIARTGDFTVSDAGILLYQPTSAHAAQRQLEWIDRAGKVIEKIGDPVDQIAVSLSHDGSRAATSILDSSRNTRDIWIYDLRRGGARTRLTSDPGDEIHSLWSPDDSSIIYSAVHQGALDLYRRASNGVGAVATVLEDARWNKYPTSWSPDGSSILYFNGLSGSRTSTDIWLLPLSTRTPVPVVQTEFAERGGRFSPDGRWIAFESDESGHADIYVIEPHGAGGKLRVTTGGGTDALWRADGRELYYLSPDARVMATEVDGSGASFKVGDARPLFTIHVQKSAYTGLYPGSQFDVAPDGKRFLVNTVLGSPDASPVTIIHNWTALLARR